ncbi:hypothetical protein DL766_001756 [Monosporascus sp. MC13-8B]|uniref:Uncharacterized protein n=1 Tax=Monosporascus cannonballus TaxID=155416 RepID=A0ABY0HJU9_9PEZI|nr:hypothetical protein DL762_001714 [Monosporascus cannonballus]RYO99435.1 hypothetical protein DL763_001459 [Monosporascus cannonballus]RYP36878.1 hypothetical protein DL766_001756 [Monosporascus sp. MC13-8B]
MNWTEGNLARGRQRNHLLVRQKQHFAKVRNNLFNSDAKQSPITISFLDIGDTGQLQRQSRTSKAPHGRYPSPSQHAHRNRQSKEKSQLEEHVRAPGANHSDKQLLSESPPLMGEKKRQRNSQDTGENDADPMTLHEKKRRLLGKADWVGLNMQQPLDIAFPGHLNRNDNSRWTKSVDRHTTKTSKLRHLIDAGPRTPEDPDRKSGNPTKCRDHVSGE